MDCDSALSLCVRVGGTDHYNLGCPAGLVDLGNVGGDDVTFTDAVGAEDNPVVRWFNILPDVRTC